MQPDTTDSQFDPRNSRLKLVILLPVYNDWECARLMVQQLDSALIGLAVSAQIVFLDDCSTIPIPDDLVAVSLKALCRVESLRLRCNLGHQRAIAVGLGFVYAQRPCDAVLVMDADGEDKPEDVPRMIQQFRDNGATRVVFAERLRRSENWTFRIFYHLYRALHRVLTGIPVRVGNFSIVPFAHLATLVVVSETWNHYAASVLKARIPYERLPTSRGSRLTGESKLNFVALVVHGLSAISVYADVVGVRLTLAIMILIALLFMMICVVVVIRLGTGLAIPGWATNATGLLLVIVLQMLTVAIGLTLSLLFTRNNLSFLPLRDHVYFVAGVHQVYEQAC
jgi:glycosyltransferase involved in cell wall biosynthesis